jgi:hypothetical protein
MASGGRGIPGRVSRRREVPRRGAVNIANPASVAASEDDCETRSRPLRPQAQAGSAIPSGGAARAAAREASTGLAFGCCGVQLRLLFCCASCRARGASHAPARRTTLLASRMASVDARESNRASQRGDLFGQIGTSGCTLDGQSLSLVGAAATCPTACDGLTSRAEPGSTRVSGNS